MNFKGYKIDIFILAPVLLMMIFSIGIVYSASSDYSLSKFGDADYLFKQHLIRVIIAVIVLFAFAKFDYRIYQDLGKYIIWAAIAFLVLLFIIGVSVKNVNRWIAIGPLSFQPSDFAKYAVIMYISALLVRKKKYVHELYRGYLPVLFYILVVSFLIALQPNFSTSLLVFCSSMLLLLISPVKFKHIMFTVVSLVPFAVFFVLTKSYIRDRISNYADYTAGGTAQHQLNQAIIGLGNGGLFGIGGGNSVQKQFFLPESYGDFIFSIIGEEYGFIGTFFVVAMFTMLLIRGFRVSKMINDEYGKYLAFGITAMIVSYAAVNMMVASGIVPTTGVPIPFVSYGGTALILNAAAAGILLNISSFRNNKPDDFVEEKTENI